MKKIIQILGFLFIFLTFAHFSSNKALASSSVPKLVFSDLYWWYPWYGMQWKASADGPFLAPVNENGWVRQDAFLYSYTQQLPYFTNPIPYLKSQERPDGLTDNSLAKDWFKGLFQRAGAAGIQVLTPMTRPDLAPEWSTALTLMIQAQKELRAEGKPYPKLFLQYDGVEYWDKISPNTGPLTGPGSHFTAISDGTIVSFQTLFNSLSPAEISDYLYTYPDGDTFPIMVYRIEGGAQNMTTDDWWITQLKINFEATFPGKHLYIILDDYWCNKQYGVNNSVVTKTCNADNYYFWGGPATGQALKSQYAHAPVIYSVGPGWGNLRNSPGATIQSRNNGEYYKSQFSEAVNGGADWIFIEDFNYGEENAAIDQATEWGNTYLDLTKTLINGFNLSTPTPTPSFKPGDLNGDGKVDINDYNLLMGNFGKTGTVIVGDIDGNGKVDIFDYNILVGNFGK